MKKSFLTTLLLLVSLIIYAQSPYRIRVIDSKTKEPIKAFVHIEQSPLPEQETDPNGLVVYQNIPEDRKVKGSVRAAGYIAQDIEIKANRQFGADNNSTVLLEKAKLPQAIGSEVDTFSKDRKEESPLFSSDSKFKILLLPFGSSFSCNEESILCERELKKFFYENEEFDNKGIEVVIDYSIKEKDKIFSKSELINKGNVTKADLIIWGDYTKRCAFDTTIVQVNYFIVENENSKLVTLKKYDTSNSYRVSNMNEIAEGKVIGDIKNICFWIMGYKEFNQGNFKQAIKNFEKISIQKKPEYAQLNHSIGLAYQQLNHYLKAIPYYSQAIALNENFLWAYNNRGNCFTNTDKFELALNDFDKVIQISKGEYPDAYLNRGIMKRHQGKNKEALDDFNQAMIVGSKYGSSNPNLFSLISANRGTCICNAGYLKEGLEDIDRAIEEDKEIELLYSAKIICLIKHNDFKNSELVLKDLLDKMPNSIRGLAFRMEFFNKMGRQKEADAIKKEIRVLVNASEHTLVILDILGYRISVD